MLERQNGPLRLEQGQAEEDLFNMHQDVLTALAQGGIDVLVGYEEETREVSRTPLTWAITSGVHRLIVTGALNLMAPAGIAQEIIRAGIGQGLDRKELETRVVSLYDSRQRMAFWTQLMREMGLAYEDEEVVHVRARTGSVFPMGLTYQAVSETILGFPEEERRNYRVLSAYVSVDGPNQATVHGPFDPQDLSTSVIVLRRASQPATP